MDKQDMGGIGKLSRKRLSEVVRHCKGCIKTDDVADCLQISKVKARNLLALWSKSGWLQRIHPGIYLPVELAAESSNDVVVDPWVVASQLYPPCYIGGWSACEYWGFTDQIFSSIVVLTAKRVNGKEQMAGNMTFLIKKQDSEKMYGLKTVWKESIKVHVSDPNKTIIDLLDDPALAGGIRSLTDMLQKYFQSEHLNTATLLEYADLMKNKTIFKRLGYLVSILRPAEITLIGQCKERISQGNSQIDPSSKGNRLIKKWRLWLPEDFENTLQPIK
jgi:predicted transcriptional regulator of viral defense system